MTVPCPKCKGSRTKVVLIKRTADGTIVRRRHCDYCEWRWYTKQLPEVILTDHKVSYKGPANRTRVIELIPINPAAHTSDGEQSITPSDDTRREPLPVLGVPPLQSACVRRSG